MRPLQDKWLPNLLQIKMLGPSVFSHRNNNSVTLQSVDIHHQHRPYSPLQDQPTPKEMMTAMELYHGGLDRLGKAVCVLREVYVCFTCTVDCGCEFSVRNGFVVNPLLPPTTLQPRSIYWESFISVNVGIDPYCVVRIQRQSHEWWTSLPRPGPVYREVINYKLFRCYIIFCFITWIIISTHK